MNPATYDFTKTEYFKTLPFMVQETLIQGGEIKDEKELMRISAALMDSFGG